MEVKFAASSSSSGVKVESKKKSVDNPRLALFERRAVELERKGWTRVLDSGDVPLGLARAAAKRGQRQGVETRHPPAEAGSDRITSHGRGGALLKKSHPWMTRV